MESMDFSRECFAWRFQYALDAEIGVDRIYASIDVLFPNIKPNRQDHPVDSFTIPRIHSIEFFGIAVRCDLSAWLEVKLFSKPKELEEARFTELLAHAVLQWESN